MDCGRPKRSNGLHMLSASVALVTCESVARIGRLQRHHQMIAADLGHDRCGADRTCERVTRDDRGRGAPDVDRTTVDKNMVRAFRKRSDRLTHGFDRSGPDAKTVDVAGVDVSDSITASRRPYLSGKTFPGLRREALGVVDTPNVRITIEHARTRGHWPGECTTAHLVDSRYQEASFIDESMLDACEISKPTGLRDLGIPASLRLSDRAAHARSSVFAQSSDKVLKRFDVCRDKLSSDSRYRSSIHGCSVPENQEDPGTVGVFEAIHEGTPTSEAP